MTGGSEGLEPGARVEVTIGPVAHGGHFVARISTGLDQRSRVIFVRHALPDERAVVAITEDSGSFLRGDAVEILAPAEDRVEAPCPLAHPDGCGGCDFQHVALPAQRELKAYVVAEQLDRLAGIAHDVVVEAVPGDEDGLRWRTRMRYVALPGGGKGLRKHRSHEVVPVADCLIEAPHSEHTMVGRHPQRPRSQVTTKRVRDRDFRVDADGFWQVHPGAPEALLEAVLTALEPRPGERVLDLYAGVGLFSAFLAEAVGPTGAVTAIESDRRATEHAVANLGPHGWADVVFGRVDKVLRDQTFAAADLVVLDPPRAGAKRQVVEAIAQLRPRAVAYVACDPAALARDLRYFADAGYGLAGLRAFDLFPMTHHVECVALLTPEAD